MTRRPDPSADHEVLGHELVDQGRALRRLARSILRATDGADDCVQDALLTAMTASTPPENRPGWLVRVVQNFARRRLRDRARRQRRHDGLPRPTPAAAPDEILAQIEQHRLVADAVLQLGEPYRTALVLRYWHDLPPRTIAKQLGLPVATVKSHLQRGLAELRQRLDTRPGGRDAWLAALAPIAYPKLFAGASAGASTALTATTTILAMNTKHLIAAVAACLCLGVFVWRPWAPPATPTAPGAEGHGAVAQAGTLADVGGADAPRAPRSDTEAAPSMERAPADSGGRTCTVVGRIVTPGDLPAVGGRIRLLNFFEDPEHPPLEAGVEHDGTFSLSITTTRPWLPYAFALADAPGWAVRERNLDADARRWRPEPHLDLGTFVLERGVAVAGRVVEADGAPLRARARLLSWDPSRRGSRAAIYTGRTAGFVEPGGVFTLPDRLSAGPEGAWMLAAVSATGVGWAKLEFAAGQDQFAPVEIRLLPGGSVDVRVVDPSGAPVPDAQVQATPHFQPIGIAPMYGSRSGGYTPKLAELEALFARTTDGDGLARFSHLPRRDHASVRDANTDQPPARALLVKAQKRGYVPAVDTVDPGTDAPATVTITLAPTRRFTFHGRVVTADGAPVPGVTVALGTLAAAESDIEGRYALPEQPIESATAYFVLAGGDVPETRVVFDLPAADGPVEHDFVVEKRAPVTGRVVDQHGAPVAGVQLHLGVPGGMHYQSTPEATGPDGVFAFPEAVPSHTELWVRQPDPLAQWRPWPSRELTTRDGETVVLHRLDGPLVDLVLTIADGRSGALVSPTEVELQRLVGSTEDTSGLHVEATLALGKATASQVRPGRYRATVRAADGLQGECELDVRPDAPVHEARCELWPTAAVVCTVDASALPADELARHVGETALVVLDPDREQSYFVDEAGVRQNYTPNTGAVRFGGRMAFRLERVTANVPLRLRVLGDDLFGETWFTARPGEDAHVTVRLVPFGRVAFAWPDSWPEGAFQLDVHDGTAWRPIADGVHGEAGERAGRGLRAVPRAAGELRWRLRVWPAGGDAEIERSGAATVRAGETSTVRIE